MAALPVASGSEEHVSQVHRGVRGSHTHQQQLGGLQAGSQHSHQRSLRGMGDTGDRMSFHLPGWRDSWFAWLLYGGGGSSLIDIEEQEERGGGLGYNVSDAALISVPLSVLALLLAVMLWRLAAPAGGDEEHEPNR